MAEENNPSSTPEPYRPGPVYQPEHVETREAPPTQETAWSPVPDKN